MQCVCAGTTVPVLVIVNISAAGVVRFTIPSVGVVGSLGFHIVSAVVDSQVEGDDGVATIDVGAFESVRVFAAFHDSLSVPIEGFASGGSGFTRGGHVHGDGEGLFSRGGTGDIVGGQSGGGNYAIFSGLRRVDGNGSTRFLRVPNVGHVAVVAVDRSGEFRASALADGVVTTDGQCAGIRLEDGEVQNHDAVGPVGGL